MLCLWAQVEQSVDVFLGSTLAYRIPTFQALYFVGIAYAIGITTIEATVDSLGGIEPEPPPSFDWMTEDATCMDREEQEWLQSGPI